MSATTKRRVKNEFHSVKIGDGAGEKSSACRGRSSRCSNARPAPAARWKKNVNEKELGILHRMGLVRFHFGREHDWPVAMAVLTPAGAQALAQEPFGHTVGMQ